MWQKLSKKIASFARNDRGVQLVELAIVLPVMMLLLASVTEFGRYFYEYTTLAKGSRTAVRYLATARANGLDDLAAKNLVVYGNLEGTGSPILTGLAITNVDITRRGVDGSLVTEGIPDTVTIQIQNFKHSSVLNLGKLVSTSSTLNVDIKPSVTMRYLLTQTPS
jgi:Flp pilus assembly protein TadG